ncbi:glycosyltransferase [Haemophilus parahaemolyticus]|uniref:glycosyltransferase family 32 protein n=1 Tax=Haemophilus parahaemolyticus TaxID=735 RepID=UPI0028D15670|nr:glycosyltransferase [Haemophilus parahaemolyticus]
MIPKKIHYCWFGNNPLPKSVQRCIKSWSQYCPDYEIIEWNEGNYNVNKIPFIDKAYKEKKYAFVSDYARLDIIYNEGGIYLDTDVELIRNIDYLLGHNCFLGLESAGEVATGLGFGSTKKHPFIYKNMQYYHNTEFDMNNIITCVNVTSSLLLEKGLQAIDESQVIDDIYIYSTEYFCPLNYKTNELNITTNTYSIHHYDATWQPFRMKIRTKLKEILGSRLSGFIKNLISF